MIHLVFVLVAHLLVWVAFGSAAAASHVSLADSLAMALPVSVLLGVWSVGYLLGAKRREVVQAAVRALMERRGR